MKTPSWLTRLGDRLAQIKIRTPFAAPGSSSEALFRGIRRRILLWFTGVVAALLLFTGAFLYISTKNSLEDPVNGRLSGVAKSWQVCWQRFGQSCVSNSNGFPGGTAPPGTPQRDIIYIMSFDADGTPIYLNNYAEELPAFASSTLVSTAIANGKAQDIIDGGNGLGAISRYAVVVRDPQTGETLGVMQVGVSVENILITERLTLTRLILVGVLMLVVSAAGGLWLSTLALEPAQISFARQQTFIADASHELRTPLTLLRSSAELLARSRDRLDPDDAELVDDILVETTHLTGLANQFLSLARLDAGVMHPETEVIDLAEIAQSTARRVRFLAEERSVQVVAESEGVIPALGDRSLVEESALILVDNALKYNREGGTVILRTSIDGERACLSVIDTGQGINADDLARLGERFYRVDKARSREMGGAGLGLAIARGLLSAQGGDLELSSNPGEGTTAMLCLRSAEERN